MARRPPLATVMHAVAFALAASMFACAVWLAWTAFVAPLELEIREGTEWIHILAKRAGVDIYDGRRVAFVNMNHGPMDAILKGWLSRAMPFLPGAMILRVFVLLSPVFLFVAAYQIGGRNLTTAFLAAGALQLFQVGVTNMTLVGRSDATVTCGLAVCAIFVHRLLQRHPGHPRTWRSWLDPILLGVFTAVVFLTCWRHAIILAALLWLTLVVPLSRPARGRFATFLANLGLFFAGFTLVWVVTLVFELHGNLTLYHKRFFGFFSAASGWGLFTRGVFSLFPAVIVHGRAPILILTLALLLMSGYRLRRRRLELVTWLAMFAAAWAAHAYLYYKNSGGGGVHYFLPFFFLAWVFMLHVLPRSQRDNMQKPEWRGALASRLMVRRDLNLRAYARPMRQLVLIGLVAAALPWRQLWSEGSNLHRVRRETLSFLKEAKRLADGEAIFGEDLHLFKSQYQGEVVDTGDTVSAIAESRYYGRALSRTFEDYKQRLQGAPPGFVMAGFLNEESRSGVISGELRDLLFSRYDIVLRLPGALVANGGCEIVLFERKGR